ncbi:MAG: AgmX/PglI C-terminal domain-containing protein [Myxococcales bacterium]|nr:AgmX/PglI C-terminal domain-containing protein [Myxococcales bacterium]
MSADSLMPQVPKKAPKYALWGLLLLLAAAGALYFATSQKDERLLSPPASGGAAAPERSSALAEEDELAIPDEEPEQALPPPKKSRPSVDKSWDCAGELDRAKAAEIMQDNRRIVRVCYERRLKVDNTLQGTTQLTLRIGPTGRVTGVKVEGTPKDAIFRSCVKSAAQSWEFPKPKNGDCAVLGQPFNLTPRAE